MSNIETITISAPRKIVINSCRDCPHKDHSGRYTEGGAWPVCSHHDVCYTIKDTSWKQRKLPVDGNKTRVYTGEIPDWCPLLLNTVLESMDD